MQSGLSEFILVERALKKLKLKLKLKLEHRTALGLETGLIRPDGIRMVRAYERAAFMGVSIQAYRRRLMRANNQIKLELAERP